MLAMPVITRVEVCTYKKTAFLERPSTKLYRSQETRKDRHSQRSRDRDTRDGGRGPGEGRGGEGEGEGEGGGGGEEGEEKYLDLPLEAPQLLPEPDIESFKVDEYNKGSFDNGDPLTTNLYVGNINPKVHMYCMLT